MIIGSNTKLIPGTVSIPDGMRIDMVDLSPQPMRVVREVTYQEWLIGNSDPVEWSLDELRCHFGGDVWFYDVESD